MIAMLSNLTVSIGTMVAGGKTTYYVRLHKPGSEDKLYGNDVMDLYSTTDKENAEFEKQEWEKFLGITNQERGELIEKIAEAMFNWNVKTWQNLNYNDESIRTLKYRELARVAVNVMERK